MYSAILVYILHSQLFCLTVCPCTEVTWINSILLAVQPQEAIPEEGREGKKLYTYNIYNEYSICLMIGVFF